jgi:hypothetical protein
LLARFDDDDELPVDTDRVRVPVETSWGSRRLGDRFMMGNLSN